MWSSLLFFLSLCFTLFTLWGTQAQRAVTCKRPSFMSCAHYCESNCPERGNECIYQCDNGCGCTPAFILRDDGGCRKVLECEFEDKTIEDMETTVKPCTNAVNEVTNANGDDRLNLFHFRTPKP